jgi:hypothetical protein
MLVIFFLNINRTCLLLAETEFILLIIVFYSY